MSAPYDLLIIGGGPAGVMSSILLGRKGLHIALLERNNRIGKKLLVTGNGRCNYTNISASLQDYFGECPDFASNALEAFSPADTLSYFKILGIEPRVEANGKVFPASEQAGSFLDLFLMALSEAKIQVYTNSFVTKLKKNKRMFKALTDDGRTFTSHNVLLCTGGKAMPSSGSDGNGYALATSLGHTLTPLRPSLVQLILEGDFFVRLKGVKLRRWLRLGLGDEFLQTEEGDLLFTDYGISGPPALQLSRPAGTLLAAGKKPWISVMLFDKTLHEMYELLEERFISFPKRTLVDALIGLLHKRLIRTLIAESNLQPDMLCGNLSKRQMYALSRNLIDWRIPIQGLKDWSHAQVTAGGINTAEVDPQTMESKLVPGLFFAGELLDIDGRSGGFNLQWAWSSAVCACEAINNRRNCQ